MGFDWYTGSIRVEMADDYDYTPRNRSNLVLDEVHAKEEEEKGKKKRRN